VSDPDPRPFGRRAFLLLTAGGLSSFAWAGWASRVFSPVTSQVTQLVSDVLPVGGWRIYTISGSMPVFDPRTWRLQVDGLVRRPRSIRYPAEADARLLHATRGRPGAVQPLPFPAKATRLLPRRRNRVRGLQSAGARQGSSRPNDHRGRPTSRPHARPDHASLGDSAPSRRDPEVRP
jgi:hypothetical protein